MLTNQDILNKLRELEKNDAEHDKKIKLIFKYLSRFAKTKQDELVQKYRPKIGFKP